MAKAKILAKGDRLYGKKDKERVVYECIAVKDGKAIMKNDVNGRTVKIDAHLKTPWRGRPLFKGGLPVYSEDALLLKTLLRKNRSARFLADLAYIESVIKDVYKHEQRSTIMAIVKKAADDLYGYINLKKGIKAHGKDFVPTIEHIEHYIINRGRIGGARPNWFRKWVEEHPGELREIKEKAWKKEMSGRL